MRFVYKLFLPLLVALSLSACGFQTVDTGHRGLKVAFGEVISEPLTEGLYFYNPFSTKIVELDTRAVSWSSQTACYTHDIQQAMVKFTVNYHLDPTQVAAVYKTIGADWAAGQNLGQIIFEEIKRELGQHDAVDVIANRNAVARVVESGITAKLLSKNIIVTGFQLTNIDYTKEFEHAVEAKVVAQQRAVEEQNHTVQIKEQAAQKVLQAEAEAKSIQIRAQALEKNDKLVQWEAVQKWNGQMPQYMMGGATPFISLNPGK